MAFKGGFVQNTVSTTKDARDHFVAEICELDNLLCHVCSSYSNLLDLLPSSAAS